MFVTFVVIAVFVITDWLLPAIINCIGMISILNYQILRYMLLHSFDLYLQELSAIMIFISSMILYWDDLSVKRISNQPASFAAILLLQCFDGYHCTNWIKIAAVCMVSLTYIWESIQLLYSIATYEDVADVYFIIPLLGQPVSVKNMRLVAQFNIIVLYLKKSYSRLNVGAAKGVDVMVC